MEKNKFCIILSKILIFIFFIPIIYERISLIINDIIISINNKNFGYEKLEDRKRSLSLLTEEMNRGC